MYTQPVGEIIKRHIIKYHCHADDTQLYITLKPCDKWDDISSSIKDCIQDINILANSNMLKLNRNRTELTTKEQVKKTDNLRIKVGSSYINSSMSVRNLELILDNTLGTENQVNYIRKFCYH